MASKKADNTSLVVADSALSVTQGITVIQERLKSMEKIRASTWKTPGKVTLSNGNVIDLKTETDRNLIITAFASIQSRCDAIEKAHDTLGETEYPAPTIDGGTLSEWKHDVKLRLAIVDQHKEESELLEMKKEWEELMGKEERKELLTKKMLKKGFLQTDAEKKE